MPFTARIHLLTPPPLPPEQLGSASRSGVPNAGRFGEVMDRINATLISAAGAPAGIQSDTWRELVEKHPDIQDPFARVIQAAPDIADATTQTVIDKLLGVLEESGLPQEADKLSRAIDSYYRYEDVAGNVCTYDQATGRFVSPKGMPCRLVKAKGGGAKAIKDLVLKELQGPASKVRDAYNRGVTEVLKDLTGGPRKLWSKLSDAWKAGILLTGLGVAATRITGLKVGRDSRGKFDLSFGVAGIGKIKIDGGKLDQLALTLPPVTLKRLTIEASGEVKRGQAQSGEIALVVPVKRTTLRAEGAYSRTSSGAGEGHVDLSAKRSGKRVDLEAGARLETGPGGQRTQVRTSAGVPIAGGRGRAQASSTTTFQPGSDRIPTEFQASVAAPINRTRTISMAAGVTGAVTTGGGAVELASSPAVTLSVAGELPTLNRRVRKAQQARTLAKQEQAEEITIAKRREAEIVRRLQASPPPAEGERVALLKELDDVRDASAPGSANRVPWNQRTYSGDVLVGAAILGGLAWGHHKRSSP
jgi:hypothetical protein